MGIIRVVLALSVIIAHVGPIFGFTLVGGPNAVESFYMISGFYMSLILNEKYIGQNGSYKLFLTNRLLRLYPIYWCVLLVTVIVCVSFGLHSHGTYWSKMQPYFDYGGIMSFSSLFLLIFTNLILLGQDLVLYLGINNIGNLFFTTNFWNTNPKLYTFLLVPQAWTISIEIAFYLIAPFIVRKKMGVIVILICISLAIRLTLSHIGLNHDPWNYRFFPNELLFFLFGSIGYKIFKRLEHVDIPKGFLAAVLIGVILFSLTFSTIELPHIRMVYFLSIFLALPLIFKLSRNSKTDTFIGDLSYPMYLSHTLIIVILKNRFTGIVSVVGEGILVIVVTILFSVILNRFIAKPIERIRQRRLVRLVAN